MRVRLRTLACTAPGVALAAAALAGCASSSPSANGVASRTPAQIVAAARSAAAGAATVHVAGSIVSAGKPMSLDMELVARKGGRGRITLGGLSLELVDVDRAVYIDGSTSFYSQFVGEADARLLERKWLKAPADRGPLASLASLADLDDLIDSTLADHGALSRAGDTTVDGQDAVGVSDGAHGGTLYVAAKGPPYPIEILEAGGGRIVFDKWNKAVTLEVPANAVNIDQLQGGR
jgi:hypothetical protein